MSLSKGGIVPIRADATDERDAERLVTEARDALGRLDVVVNNAGLVAILSPRSVRLRTDAGREIFAMVESQTLLSTPEAPPPRPQVAASVTPSTSKVVLLENSNFRELEVQEFTSQDIGDGAELYSFTGDSSPIRAGSNPPVFLLLADSGDAMPRNLELSRLQIGQGARQLVTSPAKNHSATALPILTTQAFATVRRLTVRDPLPPGEYVVLIENSHRGFLFAVH